jgi:uncharacterized protein (TIGR02444 family)
VIGMARDDDAAEAFWRFSLMVYARPGVADALIGLQDRAGYNVNLVLFGLWLGLGVGDVLDAAGLAHAKAAMEGFDRDIVGPLRRVRRALKCDPDRDVQDLRRRVLALEIAAERRVQARLARTLTPRRDTAAADRAKAAEANLRLILGPDFTLPEADQLRRAIVGF